MSTRQSALKIGAKFYIGKSCSVHGVTRRYTKSGACVQCVRDQTTKKSVVSSTDEGNPAVYYDGRIARQKGKPKVSPFSSISADHFWWLAGWNDRDMELA